MEGEEEGGQEALRAREGGDTRPTPKDSRQRC